MEQLYGDDFDLSQIHAWYEKEEYGYQKLSETYRIQNDDYSYHIINKFHVYRFLRRSYPTCLALGCAKGEDVIPVAPLVSRFIAIEPAEKWWSDQIGGVPAQYKKPEVTGDLDVPSGSVDLAVSLGVLHHIPNVSHVISEIARVLRPGGDFVLREPISTMGDWTKPRRGLTPNERGFPPGWMEEKAAGFGLRLIRSSPCMFGPLYQLEKVAKFKRPWQTYTGLVLLDGLMSMLTHWNAQYRRESILSKIAPISMFWIFRRES